jgi:hypothetical protein
LESAENDEPADKFPDFEIVLEDSPDIDNVDKPAPVRDSEVRQILTRSMTRSMKKGDRNTDVIVEDDDTPEILPAAES